MKKEVFAVVLVVCAIVVLSFALYATLKPVTCKDFACFEKHMGACTRASFVNEEPQASWKYDITQRTAEGCQIEVTLAQAKEGELRLRDFEGHSMTCVYPFGVIAYPDKEMIRCHGRLKEDLQELIIERIHSYLINNLADVKNILDSLPAN